MVIIMEKKFLFEMLETPSVSGSEFALNKKVKKHMEEYADTFITDEVGNLVSVINPDSNVKVLLAAHADEIGLMITRILNDGRCKVEEVGSITAGVYVGQRVKVITKNGPVTGMIAKFRNSFAATPKDSDLVLDLGVFSKEDADKLVEVGDYIVHDATYTMLNDDIICARALDDKIGVFAINEALKLAKKMNTKNGVYAASTVGEETTKRGATLIARRVNPTIAIAVDVTTDRSSLYELGNSSDVVMGKGPDMTIGTIMNPKLEKLIKKVAKEKNIPLQISTVVYRSYTDADVMYNANLGIPTILLSIPLRYMHSPAELVNMKDVENTAKLIAEIICAIDENTNFNPLED